jgi:putative acetyltransferase
LNRNFTLDIRSDDLRGAPIQSLLELHVERMREHSPPGSVHALDLARLQTSDITMFTAWDGETLLGCGALREINPQQGEIKSMRTADAHLGKGVGAQILKHIISIARTRGYRRLSLETGSGPAFEPALTLYSTRGFTYGEAFGGYEATSFNQFLHLEL